MASTENLRGASLKLVVSEIAQSFRQDPVDAVIGTALLTATLAAASFGFLLVKSYEATSRLHTILKR